MSQTFWTAVSAIATIGYLFASVFLWLTTRKAANAANKQAELTADVIRIAAEQAATSRQQFELSKQMFVADMQPLIVFSDATVGVVARGDQPLSCKFTLRNQGKVTATAVVWRITGTSDTNLVGQPDPDRSARAFELQSSEENTQDLFVGPNAMLRANRVTVHIEVHYRSPLDSTVRSSICVLEYDLRSRILGKTTHTGVALPATMTDLASGVPLSS